jgi:hypothetical protein
LWTRFTIPLVRLDSAGIQRVRQRIPTNHNPFHHFDRASIMVTTHNAWRRGDIHHRNITDRLRVICRLRAILQRQAMDRHQVIRAAQPATS